MIDFIARTALEDLMISFETKMIVPSHMIVKVILRNKSKDRHLNVMGPNH